ncbi:MAG: hypothetical protein N2595_01875 [bacterium]|nr:hypothetical protein [bacterium]
MIRSSLPLLLLFSTLARADIVWLTTGKALEGIAEPVDGKIRVLERDGKGEYELSTALVVRVDQGVWLEDLDPDARTQVQRAMHVPSVAEPTPALPGEQLFHSAAQIWRRLLGSPTKPIHIKYTLIVALIGLAFFTLLSLACFIKVLLAAFRHHLIAGLALLLVPPAVLVYTLFFYPGNRKKLLLALLSPFLWCIIAWLSLRHYL